MFKHFFHSTHFPYGGRCEQLPVINAPAAELRQVSVCYADHHQPILQAIDLQLPTAQRIALIGANGAGKSTLLKTLAGLIKPSSGKLSIFGHSSENCHCFRRVAYLPQHGDLDWNFPVNVYDLVMMGRYVHLGWLRWQRKSDHELVAKTLKRLKIEDLARQQISELSGGQQQRALLARTLVQQADLLLLDEPMAGVDEKSQRIIEIIIAELANTGHTVVTATHELDRLSDCFDHVIRLEHGQIKQRQIVQKPHLVERAS